MLLLASGEPRILKRWADALTGRGPLAQVDTAERLRLFLRQRRPAVVLLHLELPGLEEFGGVEAFKRTCPETRLLVFSDVPHQDEGLAVLRARAEGYANTYMMPAKLNSAVDVILNGQAWIGRELLERLLGQGTASAPVAESLLGLLTPRQKQVALLVAEGCDNREIAERMAVKERTVKSHLTAVFKKTGIKDRTQLALRLSHQTGLDIVDKAS